MRPILLEKKKWKPEIKDSWMTFFSSIVKVSKKNWLSSSPLQCIVKVFKKKIDFPLHHYNALSRFSTKVWFFPMSLLHHSALTLTYDITFQPYQCSTEIQDKNCCNRWWRKVRSRNKTKARSRTRGPTANIRSSTFFWNESLRNWFWCLQRSFSLTFDAPVIHVPGYILLQFTFLCFIFVNLASPSEGESL